MIAIVGFLVFVAMLAFLFLGLGLWSENIVFGFVSAVLFLIEGLILITTEITGIDTKFTIGIGVVLVLVGIFVGMMSYKSDYNG